MNAVDLKTLGIPDRFPIKFDPTTPWSSKLAQLYAPFDRENLEWRIDRVGKKNGRVWAKVLAYVTNRAIMERLNDVFGPTGWKNEYRKEPPKGWLCGISVYREDIGEWVTKWDGAEETQFESFKGGLSSSMKRAAVQWGIGQYLYFIEEGFAQVDQSKSLATPNWAKAKVKQQGGGEETVQFHWGPPELPAWALPPTGMQRPLPKPQEVSDSGVDEDDAPSDAPSPSTPASAPKDPEQPVGVRPDLPGVPQADQDGYATLQQMFYFRGLTKSKNWVEAAMKDGDLGRLVNKGLAWIDAAREAKAKGDGPYRIPVPVLTADQASWLIEKLEGLAKREET